MMPVCMTLSPPPLQRKCSTMSEAKKYTLLPMGFRATTRSELLQKTGTRQPSLPKWGPSSIPLCLFGLKNAPAIFSRVVISAFKEYIHKFLEVYYDDWTIFGLVKDHLTSLRLMLDKCRQHQISLNLKYAFSVRLLASYWVTWYASRD